MLIYLYSVMEDGITASLYTYLTDLTVFAKSEGIPMGTHSLHKIERQHIKMPPLGAKVPDPYAPLNQSLPITGKNEGLLNDNGKYIKGKIRKRLKHLEVSE